MPVFLAVYPGYFCYDATTQFEQADSGEYTSYHPVLHTWLLGNTVKSLHSITGSYNTAIAIYTIVQMMIISGCLTYAMYFLEKHKVSKLIQLGSMIYYCFFPVVVMYGMCSTKDSLFTAITLVAILFIIDMLLNKDKFFKSIKLQIRMVVCLFLMFAFRNNAVYAFIVFIPILIYSCKGYRKNISILITILMVIWFVYMGPLHKVLNIEKNNELEYLSIPLQQVARVYNYNPDSLTEEDLEKIYRIMEDEKLKTYNPELSDSIKHPDGFNQEELKNNYKEYIDLWISIGLRNPKMYIDSVLENTLGYWYPNTILKGYNYWGTETSYFIATTEPPGERDSKIPLLEELYYKISREATIQRLPVVSMLFSIGFMFWIVLILVGYNIYKNRNHINIPLYLILLIWLTLIPGPIVQVRYILILFYAFPLFMGFLLNGKKFEN